MSLCPQCKKPLAEPTNNTSFWRDGLTYLSFEFFCYVLFAGFISLGINLFLSGVLTSIGTIGLLYFLFWKNEAVLPAYCPSCDKTFDEESVRKAQRVI